MKKIINCPYCGSSSFGASSFGRQCLNCNHWYNVKEKEFLKE